MYLQSLQAARAGTSAVSELRAGAPVAYKDDGQTEPGADLASESAISTLIAEHWGDDGVLAGESGLFPRGSDIEWIVDPRMAPSTSPTACGTTPSASRPSRCRGRADGCPRGNGSQVVVAGGAAVINRLSELILAFRIPQVTTIDERRSES